MEKLIYYKMLNRCQKLNFNKFNIKFLILNEAKNVLILQWYI